MKKTTRPTHREIADALGITRSRVTQLKQAGMPVESVRAAVTWRDRQDTDSVEKLRLVRIELVEAQRRKIELETAVRRGELLPRSDWQQSDNRVAHAVRAALLRLEHNLPGQLAGLDEPRIAAVLQREVVAVLEDLSDQQSAYWKDNPFPEVE